MKILKQYQNLVEQIINHFFLSNIQNDFLKEMSKYALTGGKRLRSCICLNMYISSNQQILEVKRKQNHTILLNDIWEEMLQTNLNLESCLQSKLLSENICYVIVIVELLHNVSLILDDMPSMDNDKTRRGQPTVHVKYNRSNATILASFFLEQCFYLMGLCFRIEDIKMDFMLSYLNYFQDVLSREMMIATEGQNLDLFPKNIAGKDDNYWEYYGNVTKKNVDLSLIEMKTAPFFAIAFCAGYIISRVEYAKHQYTNCDMASTSIIKIMDRSQTRFDKLRNSAYQFSLGFQISDDILDIEKDNKKIGIDGLTPNYAINHGIKKAKKQMLTNLYDWKNNLNSISLWSPLMEELFNYLPNRKK